MLPQMQKMGKGSCETKTARAGAGGKSNLMPRGAAAAATSATAAGRSCCCSHDNCCTAQRTMAAGAVVIGHGRQAPGAGAGLIRRPLPSPRFSTQLQNGWEAPPARPARPARPAPSTPAPSPALSSYGTTLYGRCLRPGRQREGGQVRAEVRRRGQLSHRSGTDGANPKG